MQTVSDDLRSTNRTHGGKNRSRPEAADPRSEVAGALSLQQQEDIPHVLEIGKKYGLEFPPPPGT